MRRRARILEIASTALLLPSLVLAQAPPPAGFPGVPPAGPPVHIQRLEAEESEIRPGESTILRWEALNTYSLSIEPGIGVVASRGTQRVSPPATTTYTLTATGTGGANSRSVTVTVTGTVPRTTESAAAASELPAIPLLPDGSPDLSGLYMAARDVRPTRDVRLRAGAEAFHVETVEGDLGPGVQCLPPGLPGALLQPFPLQIVHKPDVLAIMYEGYHLFRIVPIGREHAEYLTPAWMGHSVARWEGDTLVVEVKGFNDKTMVGNYRHTEALTVTERYRRTAYDTIAYEAIIEDPNVFAEPVIYTGHLTLHPEWEIGEHVCAENNQDYDELFED